MPEPGPVLGVHIEKPGLPADPRHDAPVVDGCNFWPTGDQCRGVTVETLVYINPNIGEIEACAACLADDTDMLWFAAMGRARA